MSDGYTCPVCTRTTHHPMDAKHGYCAACHGYTSEPPPPGFAWVLFTGGGPLDGCGRLLELADLDAGASYEQAIGPAVYRYDGERFVLAPAAVEP